MPERVVVFGLIHWQGDGLVGGVQTLFAGRDAEHLPLGQNQRGGGHLVVNLYSALHRLIRLFDGLIANANTKPLEGALQSIAERGATFDDPFCSLFRAPFGLCWNDARLLSRKA